MTALDPHLGTAVDLDGARIVLLHDFLVAPGGAERVAVAMARAFPEAPLLTGLAEDRPGFGRIDPGRVTTLGRDPLGVLRRRHRWSLPLAGRWFAEAPIDADVVVCSSSGFAHLVETDAPVVLYCHTPARWLHDTDRYLERFGAGAGTAARALARRSRGRDLAAVARAHTVLANSTTVAAEIAALHDREAEVLAPPSTLDLEAGLDHVEHELTPGFVFTPSRALGYKHLEVLLDAARRLPEVLFVHAGTGPDLNRLRRLAPANVTFLGRIDDDRLGWCYRHADLVALTAAEDFGLVPREAAAFGTPSIVPAARGFLDHVVPDRHGWFYAGDDAADLAVVIAARRGSSVVPDPVDPLGELAFAERLRTVVADALRDRR